MTDVNWLVVVTAAILIVAAMLGLVNGLIKTILRLVIGVVTLILVLILSPRACAYLQEETKLPAYISTKAESVVWEEIDKHQAEQGEIILDEAGRENFVNGLPFFPALKEAVLENEQIREYANQGLEQFASYISATVADKIVVLIGYFATFVLVFFALRVLVFLLNIVEHLPLVHGLNKLAGMAVGLAEGVFIVWILGILLTVIGTTPLGQSAAECISESKFLTMLYGNNLLQQMIFWVI